MSGLVLNGASLVAVAAWKRLLQRHLLKQGDRQDLWQQVERGVRIEALLDEGDEDIDRQGNSALRLHRVLGWAT